MDEAKKAIVLARLSAGPLRDAYLDVERRGWTALMQAVQDGDEAAVARAIANGTDVDAIAEGANTALSLACTSGSEAIVTMLLAAGADASVRARRNYTLLHLAAAHCPLSVMHQLVCCSLAALVSSRISMEGARCPSRRGSGTLAALRCSSITSSRTVAPSLSPRPRFAGSTRFSLPLQSIPA